MGQFKEINKLQNHSGYHIYKDQGIFTIMQKDSQRSHIISLTPNELETFLSDLKEVVS